MNDFQANLRGVLASAALGFLLVACTCQQKDVDTVTSQVIEPGSQADLERNVGNVVYFDFDRFNLKEEGSDQLKKVADWLHLYKSYNVVIEGRTDERGSNEYNLALGSRRAESAKKYIVSVGGVDAARVTTVSYGKESPVEGYLGKTDDDYAHNRQARVVIVR